MSAALAFRATLAEDTFELALAVDSAVLAFERRLAGHTVHAAVDARLLTAIATTLSLPAIVPGLPLLDRIRAIEAQLETLTAGQRTELVDLLVQDRERVVARPMRGAQALGYELLNKADTLLLAGGAGSSKSFLAYLAMLLQSRASRFVRHTANEFTAAFRELTALIGSTDGRNLSTASWVLPGPRFGTGGRGCTMEFMSLADEDAVLKSQGRAVDRLIFDDIASGNISRRQVTFLSRWLRSTDPGTHRQLLLTANPPTSDASLWVRDMFAPWLDPGYSGVPARSGEIRHFVADQSNDGDIEVPAGTPGAESRCVVMSTISDNPRLERTGYRRQLELTPDRVLRARLLENDWSAGFDNDGDLQCIPSAWIDAAMGRWTPAPPPGAGLDAIGVDVARGGKDRSAIVCRYGDYFTSPIVRPGSATPDGPALAALVLEQYRKGAIVFPDATGVGAALVDILRDHASTAPVIFGAKYEALDATQSFGFFNVRSGLWWRLRELLDPANPRRIALPPDRVLRAELTAPRYELRGGRIFVESREDVIERVGRSPDIATAVILAAIDVNSDLAGPARGFRAALQRSSQRWRETAHAH